MDGAAGAGMSGAAPAGPELDLFDKTELWLVGIRLDDVDLPGLAAVAADALSLPRSEVFVTDVRGDHVVFDIVAPKVRMDAVIGREGALLTAIGALPGVALSASAQIHSHGVLGLIGAPADQAEAVVAAAALLDRNLRVYVARRVAIVSTGGEVLRGEISDTNLAAAREQLGAAGYKVHGGGVADDDETLIAARVAGLAEDGFGLIITTGGVGAEDKDRTIEALQRLDPDLATAILASYEVGHGRHVKPHVRVASGRIGDTLLVALPGPTREVKAALPALIAALEAREMPQGIAEAVATPIRAMWRSHTGRHGHG